MTLVWEKQSKFFELSLPARQRHICNARKHTLTEESSLPDWWKKETLLSLSATDTQWVLRYWILRYLSIYPVIEDTETLFHIAGYDKSARVRHYASKTLGSHCHLFVTCSNFMQKLKEAPLLLQESLLHSLSRKGLQALCDQFLTETDAINTPTMMTCVPFGTTHFIEKIPERWFESLPPPVWRALGARHGSLAFATLQKIMKRSKVFDPIMQSMLTAALNGFVKASSCQKSAPFAPVLTDLFKTWGVSVSHELIEVLKPLAKIHTTCIFRLLSKYARHHLRVMPKNLTKRISTDEIAQFLAQDPHNGRSLQESSMKNSYAVWLRCKAIMTQEQLKGVMELTIFPVMIAKAPAPERYALVAECLSVHPTLQANVSQWAPLMPFEEGVAKLMQKLKQPMKPHIHCTGVFRALALLIARHPDKTETIPSLLTELKNVIEEEKFAEPLVALCSRIPPGRWTASNFPKDLVLSSVKFLIQSGNDLQCSADGLHGAAEAVVRLLKQCSASKIGELRETASLMVNDILKGSDALAVLPFLPHDYDHSIPRWTSEIQDKRQVFESLLHSAHIVHNEKGGPPDPRVREVLMSCHLTSKDFSAQTLHRLKDHDKALFVEIVTPLIEREWVLLEDHTVCQYVLFERGDIVAKFFDSGILQEGLNRDTYIAGGARLKFGYPHALSLLSQDHQTAYGEALIDEIKTSLALDPNTIKSLNALPGLPWRLIVDALITHRPEELIWIEKRVYKLLGQLDDYSAIKYLATAAEHPINADIVHALGSAVKQLNSEEALSSLLAVNRQKVTCGKEVVRRLSEIHTTAAQQALGEIFKEPDLHRDVKAAVVLGLLDAYHVEVSWQILRPCIIEEAGSPASVVAINVSNRSLTLASRNVLLKVFVELLKDSKVSSVTNSVLLRLQREPIGDPDLALLDVLREVLRSEFTTASDKKIVGQILFKYLTLEDKSIVDDVVECLLSVATSWVARLYSMSAPRDVATIMVSRVREKAIQERDVQLMYLLARGVPSDIADEQLPQILDFPLIADLLLEAALQGDYRKSGSELKMYQKHSDPRVNLIALVSMHSWSSTARQDYKKLRQMHPHITDEPLLQSYPHSPFLNNKPEKPPGKYNYKVRGCRMLEYGHVSLHEEHTEALDEAARLVSII
eukprot:Blabericola_migrator_1__1579@NODE_141_length_13107_cov_85_385736_g123_i0_p1_GENE_NODE_141_length_13107_cov_85_385736_g123_i0NODE_141_length_13107_cov_85_385736_g123_i0_p1_ORF_typecomplete_len1147_score190_71HEAT_2/PF13646_6/14HEAT_2/PF13646_6/2HEAT_2/PF13646_6/1_3e02_NODE_141_length_13107_cov_85_385736_g123_i08544294